MSSRKAETGRPPPPPQTLEPPDLSSSPSPSCCGGEQLDAVAGSESCRFPLAARHHPCIDRHRDPRSPLDAVSDQRGDRDAVGDVGGDAVDGYLHSSHLPNRSSVNGIASSGRAPVTTSSASASAVTGVSRTPLR